MRTITLMIYLTLLCVTSVQAQTSTASKNEQAYQEYIRADKEMDHVYKQCLNEIENLYLKTDENARPLRNPVAEALKASQEAFVIYRAKEGAYVKALHEQGAATPWFMYTAMKKLTEERIKKLKDENQ